MRYVALFTICLFGISSYAQGLIVGTVVNDQTERSMAGAKVTIPNHSLETTTDSEGRFNFVNVPSGTVDLVVEYLGYAKATQSVTVENDETSTIEIRITNDMEELKVYGQAASTAAALNQQRAADVVSSVLTSDEFGQLPDGNLSEALQRMPGVFLERDQGEGRFVGVRGIDPGLNSTSINGVTLTAPENDTRAVALDVIPSELLETLTVKKTFTPDMDPEGLGGAIEVKSFSAFDRKGQSFRFKYELNHNELEGTVSPKMSARFSNRLSLGSGHDNFGIAASMSWYDREFGSDNIETDGGWVADLETEDGVTFKGAEEIEQRNYEVNRKRTGYALNLDFRPNVTSEYYIRTLFSAFSDQEYRNRKEYKFDKGDAISGTSTSAMWEDARLERSMKDRYESQDILSLIMGGEQQHQDWNVDFNIGLSRAKEEEPGRIDTTFRLKKVDLGYSGIGSKPVLIAGEKANDPEEFDLDEIVVEDNSTADNQSSYAINVSRLIHFENSEVTVQFGAKLRRRQKDNDLEIAVYDGFPNDPTMTPFITSAPAYSIDNFGPGLDPSIISTYVRNNRSQFDLAKDDTLISSAVGDYELEEDINAFYVMSKYKRDKIRLIYGLRFESTSFTTQGQRVVFDDVSGDGDPMLSPYEESQDYQSILPSANLRYEFNESLILRSAYFQTIARPSFGNLSPGGEVEFAEDDGETEFKAEIGNPGLDPLTASNFDLSIENYLQGIGIVAVGFFHKQINDFVVLADVAESTDLSQFVGNIGVDDAELIAPINGETANITGFELTWTKKFNELPVPFNGLLLNCNATFSDSEATLELRDSTIPMPKQADRVFNLGVGYDTQTFSFRLAMTSKSDVLIGLEDPADPEFDIYQSGHTQVDFSLKYFPRERWRISVDGNNLTDEPYFAYFQDSAYNAQYETYGRTLSMGIQYRF